ncbi:unnamed protein product [Paramecium octaurelia]|uniref:Transmembrane protein n=1 Tax=Paramecium octaurelia TaxID=43137 RepID=A0A8S1VMF3_PAROT|nr:unnamed protein product [Paramecium octaurelia]
MSFQGLQKALLLNGWDMIFKTLLYTRCIQTKSYIDIVQLIMVCIILLLYFQILLTFMKCNQQFSTVSKNQRFEILSFGRQFFFLLVLIYIQHMPVLQLGLVLLTSLLQTISLQKYRCTLNKKSYIVQMVVEKSVTIFTLSSFVYISKFNNYIYQEKKIILGWIQAMILSTGIIIELISICIESILKFKLMRRKKSVTQKSQLFI